MENMNSEGNTQQKTESMSIADRFITAMFLPKEYGRLMKLTMGKIVSYLFLLILLVSVIQYGIPTLGAIAGMGGIRNIILNEIPDFSLKDGKFSFGEKIEQQDDDMGVYILVDTSKKKFTKEDVPEEMAEAVLVSQSNILLYNNVSGIGGILQEDTFDNYKALTLSNEILADGAFWIYVILGVIFVGIYFFMFAKYLFAALFYAAIMYLLAKTMMMDLTFGKVYLIALFAQSLGGIVQAVTYCIGSPVLMLTGSAFNMLVTVILMNKALITMKMESEAL
ncbi:MAG: DUF1189 domain-containing protein [Lachnospiraceae bacterium]